MTTRVIAGTVNKDGTIRDGKEFSVVRTEKGRYAISFRPAFASILGAAATQVFDGNTRDNVVFPHVGSSELLVKTGDSGGDRSDRPFTFVAVGIGEVAAAEEQEAK